MKHTIPLLLFAVLFMASTVSGDLTGDATATVIVTVNPNVTVGVITGVVDAGTVQTGEFWADVLFRVDANQQQLCLQVEATPLYKGDDPTDNTVAAIPLAVLDKPVTIAPTDASPMGGESNEVFLSTTGSGIGDFPSFVTTPLCFESSQNNHFSQDVLVTVWWVQVDPEQPTGEYSGRVRLLVFLLDAPSAP